MPPTTARHTDGWHFQLLLFAALVAFRLVNAYFLRTFFQPDEFFQSLEPAWQWAFGAASGAWITWEWKEQLRSSLHPLLFAMIYKGVAALSTAMQLPDQARADFLSAAPRLFQAIFAALMDLFTWRLAGRVYSHSSTSWTALALSVLSPWHWFCSVRTFSNSIEATMTVIALDFFPWSWFWEPSTTEDVDTTAYGYLQASLIFAAIAVVLRPTNIIIWAAVSVCLAVRGSGLSKTATLAECAVLCGGAVLAVSAGMDRMYYGEWTLPAFRFLYFNLVQSMAVFYGTNRIDYYFTEGLPLLLTTALPFGLVALWQALRPTVVATPQTAVTQQEIRFAFAVSVLAATFALTAIAHKEVRFLYPLLPVLLVLAAGPVKLFFDPSRFAAQRRKIPFGTNTRLVILGLLLGLNLLIAGYVSQYHQRGVMDVVHYLRERQEARTQLAAKYNTTSPDGVSTLSDMTVAFLMPCHSTPWRSALVHSQIDAWALTCEPPLDIKPAQRGGYRDEADRFYDDPRRWIERHMRSVFTVSAAADPGVAWDALAARKKRKWPQYLVFFEALEPMMQEVLAGSMYRECRRFFNSHWHDDARRRGDVVVWCLHSP